MTLDHSRDKGKQFFAIFSGKSGA